MSSNEWWAWPNRTAPAELSAQKFSHLSAEHFREHFAVEARDTAAAGATLEIETSDDFDNPAAQHVRLESVDLE